MINRIKPIHYGIIELVEEEWYWGHDAFGDEADALRYATFEQAFDACQIISEQAKLHCYVVVAVFKTADGYGYYVVPNQKFSEMITTKLLR